MKLQHTVIEKFGQFLGFLPTEDVLQEGILDIDQLTLRICQLEDDTGPFVMVSTLVGVLDQGNLGQALALLMSANHCWRGTNGGTLSYDPLTAEVHLAKRLNKEEIEALEEHEVGREFLGLYEAAMHWQAALSESMARPHSRLSPRAVHALSFGKASAKLQ